jgi:4-hydroxybenzoyl-CoA thioesterase
LRPRQHRLLPALFCHVRRFHRSSFEVIHRVYKGDQLAIEAFETRVLVGRHPDNPDKLKSAPMPQEIIEKLMQG